MKPREEKPLDWRGLAGLILFLATSVVAGLAQAGFLFGLQLGLPIYLGISVVGGMIGGFLLGLSMSDDPVNGKKMPWFGMAACAIVGPCGLLAIFGYTFFRTQVYLIEIVIVELIAMAVPGFAILIGLLLLFGRREPRRRTQAASSRRDVGPEPGEDPRSRAEASYSAEGSPLLSRLAVLRMKVRVLDGWQGTCALVALILGVSVTVGVLDYLLQLPTLGRAVFLVGMLIGVGYVAYTYLIKPFARPCDDLQLALRVEEVYPELNDALASSLQFLKQSKEEQARVGGSNAMRARTVEAALAKADQCDFGRILDRRGAALCGVAAFVVAITAAALVGTNGARAGTAFWRFVEPFGGHTWTTISVERSKGKEINWEAIDPTATEKDRIAHNQPYRIKVELRGRIPPNARVEIEGQIRADQVIAADKMKVAEDKRSVSFELPIHLTQQYHKEFKFRVLANDGAFPPRAGTWHMVQVLPKPKLELLDGQPSPHIELYPPAYTDLRSPDRQPPGTRHLRIHEGPKVSLRAKADRPLVEAWLEIHEKQKQVEKKEDGDAADVKPAAQAVVHRSAAEFEADRSVFRFTFTPPVNTDFINLQIRDKHGLDADERIELAVERDPLPEIRLAQPSPSILRVPDGEIKFKFKASDELFAIRSAFIEYRPRKADGTPEEKETFKLTDYSFQKLREEQVPDEVIGSLKKDLADKDFPSEKSFTEELKKSLPPEQLAIHRHSILTHAERVRRIVIYSAQDHAQLLPILFAKMGRTHVAGPMTRIGQLTAPRPALRLRPKELDFDTTWHLRNQFKVGDKIMIEVGADDFCDIDPARGFGKSHAIELTIVAPRDIVAIVEEKVNKMQKEIKRIEAEQKKAMDTVNEVRKMDKITPKAKDDLSDADQTQRKIQEDVGKNPEQGLRGQLKELQQLMKDNKEIGSKAAEQVNKMKGALDHIAQAELPQIEPKLAEARNDIQTDKKTPKTTKNLEQTARLQNDVLKAIGELNKELAPDFAMQKHREKFRELLQKQETLRQDLENLNAQKREGDKDENLNQEQHKKAMRQQFENKEKAQRELAEQMRKAVQDLQDAKKQAEKTGDKDTAKQLDEALKKAIPDPNEKQIDKRGQPKQPDSKDPIAAKMNKAADELKNRDEAPPQVLEQQKQIAKDVEKVLDALENRNKDVTKQEIKNRQEAEKKIDQVAKELKQLQKEAQALQNEKDKEERVKKKEELIQKHEELRDKIAKMEREVARLQEQRAADELRQAADKVDDAIAKLQQDQDPQQQQKAAQQKLQEAKLDLQEAEEELAREALIKIADKLKGLKEREDALVQRSEDFHARIMERKRWTEGNLDSIDGNMDAQKAVAEETDTLREKVAQAKIFSDIMEKAKASMDTAAKLMETRKELGLERREAKMDADKLKEEVEYHDDTVKNQKDAVKRLDRLLDALKEQINKPRKPRQQPKEDVAEEKDPKKEEKKQARQGPRDGIPPMAELKLLKAEQLDLKERTEEFDRKHPDAAKLNDKQSDALRALQQEQERLQSLFLELVAPPMDPMGPALPNEGEKK